MTDMCVSFEESTSNLFDVGNASLFYLFCLYFIRFIKFVSQTVICRSALKLFDESEIYREKQNNQKLENIMEFIANLIKMYRYHFVGSEY